jgi:DNA-binding ferritin-like protein
MNSYPSNLVAFMPPFAPPADTPQMWQLPEEDEADETPEPPTGEELARTEPEGLTIQLTILASFLDAIRLEAHLLHLNYTGANFLSIHGFAKEQYQTHLESFDTACEHVRALGGCLPSTVADMRNVLPCYEQKDCGCVESLEGYRQNLLRLVCMCKKIEKASGCAIDVANSMAEIVAHANRSAWFLSATLS